MTFDVLALHGFAQDSRVFNAKIGAVRKALKSTCAFTFIDGPIACDGTFDDDDDEDFNETKERSSASATSSSSSSRAWFAMGENIEANAKKASDDGWTRPALSRDYARVDETLRAIADAIKANGRAFDGIIAFSQGATAAVLAIAGNEELRGGLKFAVLAAGFSIRDARANEGVKSHAPFAIRSLHIHGDADALVTRERVEELAMNFEKPQFFFHPGAHGVPSAAAKAIKAFVQDVANDRARED